MSGKKDGSYKYMYLTTAAICVAVAVMLFFFVLALSKFAGSNDDVSEEASAEQSTVSETSAPEVSETSAETSEPAKQYKYLDSITRQEATFRNTDVLKGSLAALDGQQGFPEVKDADLGNIYNLKTSNVYGLENVSLLLNPTAIKNFDNFLVSFCQQVTDSGIYIRRAYMMPEVAKSDPTYYEFASGFTVELASNGKYKFTDTQFSYLRDQCYKYGIINRYPEGKEKYTGHDYDPKIFKYVGLAHSWYMNYYGYSLEEYIDKIHTEKVIEYESQIESNVAYVIYYVPAGDGDTTSVPVPADPEQYPYTYSGDGSGGFIVTVRINTAA